MPENPTGNRRRADAPRRLDSWVQVGILLLAILTAVAVIEGRLSRVETKQDFLMERHAETQGGIDKLNGRIDAALEKGR